MQIAREEIFGPVMQIIKFDTLDEVGLLACNFGIFFVIDHQTHDAAIFLVCSIII